MLINTLCVLGGMVIMYCLTSIMALGHSINILKQTQQSVAAMFVQSEQGLQEVLQLKYIAMKEAKRSEQNIRAQQYIDQLGIQSIKAAAMRNYVATFPKSYLHIMEYSTWEELEDYVNEFTRNNKGK